MFKKFFISLIIVVVAVGLYWIYPNLPHEKVKRSILSQYLTSQYEISNNLNNALSLYHEGNEEEFIQWLVRAKEQAWIGITLTGNGLPINYKNKIINSYSLYDFQSKANSQISTVFSKAIEGTLTEADISELELFAEKMNNFVADIDHKDIIEGNTTRQIVREIENIIEKNT